MAKKKTFKKILIANRGEIACRIILTAKIMGIKTAAVYSDADVTALHTILAHEAHYIGPAPSTESYLNADAILKAAKEARADAIHPGYGFLAENADFAEACKKAGITFIGPTAKSIRAMGSKEQAKRLMEKANVPVVPGYHGDAQGEKTLKAEAKKVGYPILIKAVAGGGGKGMRKVESEKGFSDALKGARREAKSAFGNDKVLIEKFIEKPRHIEVQVFGDAHGNAVHLFERDCSIQRRHQKVIEEAPAPGMPDALRQKMCAAAVAAVKAIKYQNAGTIEFIVDASKPLSANTGFYFMEMNTRLQVEHPVTEMVTGLDLVEWQILVASGQPLPLAQSEIKFEGHAIEARLYAEDPENNFLPQTGKLEWLRHPDEDQDFRWETGYGLCDKVTVYYDPMLAKIVCFGDTREEARRKITGIIEDCQIAGVKTNLAFLHRLLAHPAFAKGDVNTGFIEAHPEVLKPKKPVLAHELVTLAVAGFLAEREFEESLNEGGADKFSPWAQFGGWRMNHAFAEKLTIAFAGKSYHLKIGRDELSNLYNIQFENESPFRILPFNYYPPSLEVSVLKGKHEKTHLITVHQAGDVIYLMDKGTTHDFEVVSAFSEMEVEMQGPGTVIAPMPGRILEVLAKKGQNVKKDAGLVVMEAMKMEYTLKSPRDGVIKALDVLAGQQVKEGDVLLEIEKA